MACVPDSFSFFNVWHTGVHSPSHAVLDDLHSKKISLDTRYNAVFKHILECH